MRVFFRQKSKRIVFPVLLLVSLSVVFCEKLYNGGESGNRGPSVSGAGSLSKCEVFFRKATANCFRSFKNMSNKKDVLRKARKAPVFVGRKVTLSEMFAGFAVVKRALIESEAKKEAGEKLLSKKWSERAKKVYEESTLVASVARRVRYELDGEKKAQNEGSTGKQIRPPGKIPVHIRRKRVEVVPVLRKQNIKDVLEMISSLKVETEWAGVPGKIKIDTLTKVRKKGEKGIITSLVAVNPGKEMKKVPELSEEKKSKKSSKEFRKSHETGKTGPRKNAQNKQKSVSKILPQKSHQQEKKKEFPDREIIVLGLAERIVEIDKQESAGEKVNGSAETPGGEERFASFFEDYEIEPDYDLVEFSVSGLSYDLDAEIRKGLYSLPRLQAGRSGPAKISLEKHVRVPLKIPDSKEVDNGESLAVERGRPSEHRGVCFGEKSLFVSASESPPGGIGLIDIHREPLEKQIEKSMENDQLLLVVPKVEAMDRVEAAGEGITPPRQKEFYRRETVIASGAVREELKKHGGEKNEEEVKRVDFRGIRAQVEKEEKKAVLVASTSDIGSNSRSKEEEKDGEISGTAKIEGTVRFPGIFKDYAKGHVEIFLLDRTDKDGYPDEYSENIYQVILESGKKPELKFIVENIEKGTRGYLVAEFFPSGASFFEDGDNRKFLGFPNGKPGGEPLQIEGDISGIELFFPKITEAGVKGIAGEIVPFAMPQESRPWLKKGKEEAAQGSNIENAEVRIIGTELRAFTDVKGSYSFTEAPEVPGISYSVSGSGLYPVVFSSCRRFANRVPVFSDVQVEKFFKRLALINVIQEKNRGILIGRIISKESPGDIYVDLSTLDADGPFYFNVKRELDPGLEFPGENGLFAYFNVPGGLHTVGPRIGDEELPGGVVDVYSGTISYIHIDVDTTHSFRGFVRNAFLEEKKNQVPGATVSLIGAPNGDSIISDEKGYFELKDVRAINNINTIEITVKDFVTTRVTGCFSGRELEIYVFPIRDSESFDGIETILRENNLNYDPSMGMVMGSIMRGGSLTLDIPDADRAKIVYFDPRGNIDLSRKSTSPIDGNFLILNVPVGQRNIISYDEKGNIRNYFTIRSGGSIISSVTSY